MKTFKFILSCIFVSFLLLFSVVIVDLIFTFAKGNSDEVDSVSEMYALKEMLLGILSETLRALLLCYLFPKFKSAGCSYKEGALFGLAISALIGTMWLIIGYGSFILKNPNAFVLYDAIILFLQGLLSGLCLQYLYKKNYI